MTDVQPGKVTHPPFDPETVPALEQVRAKTDDLERYIALAALQEDRDHVQPGRGMRGIERDRVLEVVLGDLELAFRQRLA